MRAVICGDTHIGAVFGLGRPNGLGGNTRVDDYEATLNSIIDYTISSKADIMIIKKAEQNILVQYLLLQPLSTLT